MNNEYLTPMSTDPKPNCLLIYGGGLCPCANAFITGAAERLKDTNLFETVFVGFDSFGSLIMPKYIKPVDSELFKQAQTSRGGFYGTIRGIDLTRPKLMEAAIRILKEKGITWIFVAGGDGSSRQTAEIAEKFFDEGIKVCFMMPLTIDGIEGGYSLGLNPAVNVTKWCIEHLVSTCFMTADVPSDLQNDDVTAEEIEQASRNTVLCVETQGRNRDDIMATTLKKFDSSGRIADFPIEDIALFVVPANIEVPLDCLAERVESEDKPTLVIYSEGASYGAKDMKEKFKPRKTRSFKVGHLSQMNDMIEKSDLDEMTKIFELLTPKLSAGVQEGIPFSLVVKKGAMGSLTCEIAHIEYFATHNPRKGQIPTISHDLKEVMEKYLP